MALQDQAIGGTGVPKEHVSASSAGGRHPLPIGMPGKRGQLCGVTQCLDDTFFSQIPQDKVSCRADCEGEAIWPEGNGRGTRWERQTLHFLARGQIQKPHALTGHGNGSVVWAKIKGHPVRIAPSQVEFGQACPIAQAPHRKLAVGKMGAEQLAVWTEPYFGSEA